MGKKRADKNGHKNVQDIENNGYKDARYKKERKEEIAPTLAKCFKLQQERDVSKSIVELG
jgi:hypothetical protein